MIPKKIHYCWLSGDPLPRNIRKCIDTWRRIMPDYELKLWDTKAFDITSVPFVEEACRKRKWAFAADYIRMYALYTEGGIYLDSDVKVTKRFDDLLGFSFMSSLEYHPTQADKDGAWDMIDADGHRIKDGFVSGIMIQAAVMGAEAGCPFVKDVLDWYGQQSFINPDGSEEYEAFYRIDMAAVDNPENVVVTAITSNTGSAAMSHWFRFIDESGAEIEGINGNAVIDLSGYDTVYLYLNLIVRSSAKGDARFHVYFRNPVLIGDGDVKLEPSQTYLIGPASASLLVVENDGGGLGAFANSLNARYAGSGKHFSNVFPVRLTDSRIEINIPEHSEPIMFDYSGRELSAHLEPVPAGFAIESMGKGERTFTLSEGTAIFPVIFTVSSPGGTITLESEGGSGRLGLRHESGNGYATETLGPGRPYTVADSRYLEYFFFRNDTGKECSFTLTVQ